MSEEEPLSLPETAEAWRACLETLSSRDLFRLIQAEKAFPSTLFTGFRPGADALRRPAVVERLTKFLVKQPALAKKVVELPRVEPKPVVEKLPPAPSPPSPPSDDTKLKEKVRVLRAQLQDAQRHCSEQDTRLAQALAERDMARETAATAQKDYQALVERTERERRQREAKPLPPSPPKPRVSTPVAPPPPPLVGPLEEALERLLHRGKHPMVAGLCRELLAEEGLESPLRASLHGLYATALVGLGHESEASEQERLATEAFLDAGRLERAGESLSRSVTHRPEGALRPPERATLQRFLLLTARAGTIESALLPLRRLRLLAPGGFRSLCEAVRQGGKKHAAALTFLSAAPTHQPLGANEPVALPTAASSTATVTAQGLVNAVAGNDEELIRSARRGLVALHESTPALADALLESIAQLAPFAVFTFVRPRLRPVVVDASNVARYVADPLAQLVQKKHVSRLAPLLILREHLLQRGYFPILMIADASLRHHIDEKAHYAQLVQQHTIHETPAGTEADEALLFEARRRKAPLITRDRFSDWGTAAQDVERLTFEIYSGGVALLAD